MVTNTDNWDTEESSMGRYGTDTYNIEFPGSIESYTVCKNQELNKLGWYGQGRPMTAEGEKLNHWYTFSEDGKTYFEYFGTSTINPIISETDPRDFEALGEVNLLFTGRDYMWSDVFSLPSITNADDFITVKCTNLEKAIEYDINVPISEIGYSGTATIYLPVGYYCLRLNDNSIPFEHAKMDTINNYIKCYVREAKATTAQFYFMDVQSFPKNGQREIDTSAMSGFGLIPTVIAVIVMARIMGRRKKV